MGSTVVLIPAFNESATIGDIVHKVKLFAHEVVVIDDGSFDDTAYQARTAGAHVLRHLINRGQGAALQTGTEFALTSSADIIVHFDADGQMDPKDIPLFLAALNNTHTDIVLGSRYLGNVHHNHIPFLKRATHTLVRFFHSLCTGLHLSDAHCGFRAFRSSVAPLLCMKSDRMSHATEIEFLISRHRLRYKEVPVSIDYSAYAAKKSMPFISHAWQVVRDGIMAPFVDRE